jgi:predicted lipoprotein with Yx(FWY)xxD motif
MPARQHAGAAASSSERGVLGSLAALSLLGLLGYLAATGQLANGATQSHATVSLRSTAVGKVLVTSTGHTLYLFMKDRNGKSSCTGQCAKFWPPLTDLTKPLPGVGVKASLLGRTRRADGRMQVTYNHHPLYTFLPDKRAGQTTGEGVNHFGGLWWAVSSRGIAVKKTAATTTTTTTTSSTTTTSGGYGGGGYSP